MRILFDQGVPAPLRRQLAAHAVDTAFERGWSNLSNSALLDRAEAGGYRILVTTDQNLRHQQNLAGSRLAVVVLAASWPRIRQRVDNIRAVVDGITPGQYIEVPIRARLSMTTTDATERGLERLVCTVLTGSSCEPPFSYNAGWVCVVRREWYY